MPNWDLFHGFSCFFLYLFRMFELESVSGLGRSQREGHTLALWGPIELPTDDQSFDFRIRACNDGMVFRIVSKRVKQVYSQCNPITWSRKSRKQTLSESCFFVNRSIFEILQENWKRVVLFSPRLRLGLGRPFDMFREIVIPFWALTCAVCCANASESLFDKIYDEIMKLWWYSSINGMNMNLNMIWICGWICEAFCLFLSFFAITLFWSSEVGLNLSHS